MSSKNTSDAVVQPPEVDLSGIDALIEPYLGEKGTVIPVLQSLQNHYGYLPRSAVEYTARRIRVPLSRLYGVATFYAQFKMKPRGRNIIRVCKGTACHIQGSSKIAERIEEILGISGGDTTPDLRFTLEEVACIGACALAPVMTINDQPHGRLTPDRIKKILDSYE
ncbi:MAG: NADH-quinone oxidoreductase subunit NuoE [Dethiobacteria bacterium]